MVETPVSQYNTAVQKEHKLEPTNGRAVESPLQYCRTALELGVVNLELRVCQRKTLKYEAESL